MRRLREHVENSSGVDTSASYSIQIPSSWNQPEQRMCSRSQGCLTIAEKPHNVEDKVEMIEAVQSGNRRNDEPLSTRLAIQHRQGTVSGSESSQHKPVGAYKPGPHDCLK